jgi:hypothetical protein
LSWLQTLFPLQQNAGQAEEHVGSVNGSARIASSSLDGAGDLVRRQLKKEVVFLRFDVAGAPTSDSWVSESSMSKEIVIRISSVYVHMYGRWLHMLAMCS